MTSQIHPTAIVSPKAQLGNNVSIGPFCIVEDNVTLGDNTKLISHVSLAGTTTLGKDCVLYPYVSMGHPPQDFKHKGGAVSIEVGDRCTFRENSNVHPGTDAGNPVTRIGNECYFMVGTHLAHEGQMGNNCVISNGVQIGGNVVIGNHVILGGMSAIHQNTRIGDHAFVGGGALVTLDVIPYGSVIGNSAHLAGLNVIGLKRRGFSREKIRDLRSAYRLLFAEEGTFAERLEYAQEAYPDHELVMDIVSFVRDQDKRRICMPHTGW